MYSFNSHPMLVGKGSFNNIVFQQSYSCYGELGQPLLLSQFSIQFLDCLLCCVFVCFCLADSCLHTFDLAFVTFSFLLRIFGNILTECLVLCHQTLFIIVDYFFTCCSMLTKFTYSDISIKLIKEF